MGLTVFHGIFFIFIITMGIFSKILSVPQNTLMDMNNVMNFGCILVNFRFLTG